MVISCNETFPVCCSSCLTLENFLICQDVAILYSAYSVIVYLPWLHLNQLSNPKLDVSDEVLSLSSKQCWWLRQLDIWSCEYKFSRLYKESISKELSNDLNLHSMTKLLDCMYAIAIYMYQLYFYNL